MNDYTWGLLTLPLGVTAVCLCIVALKAAYLALGWLGRAGVVRFGGTNDERRYRMGAVVATSKRIIVLNKGTTGAIFFTGEVVAKDSVRVFRVHNAIREASR